MGPATGDVFCKVVFIVVVITAKGPIDRLLPPRIAGSEGAVVTLLGRGH